MGKFIETKVLGREFKRKQFKNFTRNNKIIENFKISLLSLKIHFIKQILKNSTKNLFF